MMFFKKSLTLFVFMISFTQVVLSVPDSGPFANTGAGEISSMSKRQIQDLSDGAGTIHYDHPLVKRQIQDSSNGYGNIRGHAHGKRKIPDGYGTIRGHAHGKREDHNNFDRTGNARGHVHGKRQI